MQDTTEKVNVYMALPLLDCRVTSCAVSPLHRFPKPGVRGSIPFRDATLRPVGLPVAGLPEDRQGEGCLPKLREERRETGALWYVYFLELTNRDIYVGSTNDLRRSVKSHDNGHVASTKSYLPVTLESYVAVETEATAGALERYFKSGAGKAVAKKRFISC
jgi:putative endonuclease